MDNNEQARRGWLKDRWKHRTEAIERIIETAKRDSDEDWTPLLADIPSTDEVEPCIVYSNDGTPRGTTRRGKDLRGIDLEGKDLRGIHLEDARLEHANLSDSRLDGAFLQRAELEGANLDHSSLNDADLSGSSLVRASLQYADLTSARLSHATLRHANLQHSELVCANLDNAVLIQADLKNATLDQASMRNASLSRANLSGASLRATNFTGAYLSRAILEDAKVDHVTKFWCQARGLLGREIVREEEEAREDQRRRNFENAETAYAEAQSVYHGLAVAYRQAGIHNEAATCYYREMVCHRKARYPKYLTSATTGRNVPSFRALLPSSEGTFYERLWLAWKWLFVASGRIADLVIFDWLCGYGEKLWRTVTCIVGVILLCALFYYCFADQIARSRADDPAVSPCILELTLLPFGTLPPFLLTTAPAQIPASRDEATRGHGLRNYGEALYFSVVVFTTLGFGDLHPDLPWDRITIVKAVVAFEALSGVVLMSLLMAIFFRRVLRQ